MGEMLTHVDMAFAKYLLDLEMHAWKLVTGVPSASDERVSGQTSHKFLGCWGGLLVDDLIGARKPARTFLDF